MTVLYNVEVRDDHDGGSVWYTDDEHLETVPLAEESAREKSRLRDNGAARVVKVTYEPLTEFDNGLPVRAEGSGDGR